MSRFEVGIVGCGYVGLVTGACLAHLGHRVVGVDVEGAKVRSLEAGVVPFYEPGLEELVASCVKSDRLRFSTDLAGAVGGLDVIFIAVDTPTAPDGSADLENVASVAQTVGATLAKDGRFGRSRERPLVVVNKSTVPVGSGDYVSMLVEEGAQGKPIEFLVVSNPEFLREGSAVQDALHPDRIVVGTDSEEALAAMRDLYGPIIEQSFPDDRGAREKVPFVATDLVSAEMVKYAANAFLAARISFINEVAALCELVGADVKNVAGGIGLDDRIGPRFLNAGIGWGGSCFPKDVSALRAIAREYDFETKILDAAVEVNERQRKQVISKLQHELHTLKGRRIALLGLAFKPNTDDLREAPSLKIAGMLNSLGARVVGYDPVAGKRAAKVLPTLKVVSDPYEALAGAHAAVVVTEWEEVCALDLGKVSSAMERPKVFVDGRNVFDPKLVRESGMFYSGFGRG